MPDARLEVTDALAVAADQRTKEQKDLLRLEFQKVDP